MVKPSTTTQLSIHEASIGIGIGILKLLTSISFFLLFFLFSRTTSSFPTTNAAPADTGHGIPDWLWDMAPDRGNDMSHNSEIACYALPYGLIGTISHVLTWYTIGILTFGRSPLRPWRILQSPKVDILLAASALLGGVVLTVFTMIRCQQRWQFLLIAGWKALLSISLGAFSLHVSVLVAQWHSSEKQRPADGQRSVHEYSQKELCGAIWWLVLYILGMVVGLAGLISLVREAWLESWTVRITTYVCGGAAVVMLAVWALYSCCYIDRGQKAGFRLFVVPLTLGLIAALYSDWILAGLAENLIGVPSGDVAPLYFAYFAAKRLPIFSF
ncbi:hypothetical protein BZA05DRAFT_439186 [Tricharina praecox]|uniref:uncharacterized protein n=1 Tax=Tricharina praecox TaxID=43433 RepID=UPI00221E6EC1|nr:uncharacterized protein BZA05DRAFT_439186 [Tricharina praecox]KAI5843589.1 hypothetical protein BZA05DRAFT_439186 [Tricharina praecox]